MDEKVHHFSMIKKKRVSKTYKFGAKNKVYKLILDTIYIIWESFVHIVQHLQQYSLSTKNKHL